MKFGNYRRKPLEFVSVSSVGLRIDHLTRSCAASSPEKVAVFPLITIQLLPFYSHDVDGLDVGASPTPVLVKV